MPCRATVSNAWQPVWTTTSPNLSTSRRSRQCWPDGWRRRQLLSSLPCEHPLNSSGEFVNAPGFGEERVNPHGLRGLGVHGMTKARTQNDRNVGADAPQGTGQGIAREAWHGLVGHNKVVALRCGPEGFQGFQTTEADADPIAEIFKHDLSHLGHCSFVIDQQDIALPPRQRLCLWGVSGRRGCDLRQIDLEGGSLAWRTGDCDGTLMACHQTMDQGQTHARTLPRPFRGEERFEHAGEHVRR